jgi:hypothetical protein
MHHARESKAFRLHDAECVANNAVFYNEGWSVENTDTWISIASKTSKGILRTDVDFSTTPPTVEHAWETA